VLLGSNLLLSGHPLLELGQHTLDGVGALLLGHPRCGVALRQLRHFLGTLQARELQDGSACQLRLLQVVVAALFELGRHLLRDFAFLVGQLLRLAGVVRVPLVAGDEFLFVDLDGLVLPVCAFDRDFELEGACLLFGVVFGLFLVGFVVSRCFLGRLFGVVLGDSSEGWLSSSVSAVGLSTRKAARSSMVPGPVSACPFSM
jgi:hypothetical protein